MRSGDSGEFSRDEGKWRAQGDSNGSAPAQAGPARAAACSPRPADLLLPAVYGELRAMAQSLLAEERPDHTLQATALVHEAYLKLVDQSGARCQDQAHFFAVAAQAMRRILVDHARGKERQKRGGGHERRLLLADVCLTTLPRDIDLLALDEALEVLAAADLTDARIVEMRFFAGLKVREIAAVLGIAEKTVQRRWNYAKARLHQLLEGHPSETGNGHEPGAHSSLA